MLLSAWRQANLQMFKQNNISLTGSVSDVKYLYNKGSSAWTGNDLLYSQSVNDAEYSGLDHCSWFISVCNGNVEIMFVYWAPCCQIILILSTVRFIVFFKCTFIKT